MLGPNKWRLLTIVAGILLAHAIESPTRSSSSTRLAPIPSPSASLTSSQQPQYHQSLPSTAPTNIGLTIEQVLPGSKNNDRTARNLYTPFKRFSNVDTVRFVERRHIQANDLNNVQTSFGAFRYAHAPSPSLTSRRRSDIDSQQIGIYELINTTYAQNGESIATTSRPTLLSARQPKYNYIPLRQHYKGKTNKLETSGQQIRNLEYFDRTTPSQEFQSRTDLNIYQSEQIPLQQEKELRQTHPQEFIEPDFQPQAQQTQQQQLPQSKQQLQAYQPQVISTKIVFPDSEVPTVTRNANQHDEIQGRRSGITFTPQTPKSGTPFIPHSYQEDDPASPNFQNPYSEELGEQNEIRTARGAVYDNYPSRSTVHFPGPSSKPFRDDVTKFGDVNGPVTSVQRQFSDYLEAQGIRTYENIYYSDDYRRPRQYYPSVPKSPYYDYSEYTSQPPRSRLIQPYKSARSPRVIFPTNDNYQSGLGVSSYDNYNNNENIVFR